MKIYLLKQDYVNGYDTYDSLVVIANNEEEAKNISPYNRELEDLTRSYGTWVGKDNIDKIEVIYLGEAKEGSEKGIVLASFNAG
jgi:hypothetical protein